MARNSVAEAAGRAGNAVVAAENAAEATAQLVDDESGALAAARRIVDVALAGREMVKQVDLLTPTPTPLKKHRWAIWARPSAAVWAAALCQRIRWPDGAVNAAARAAEGDRPVHARCRGSRRNPALAAVEADDAACTRHIAHN